MCEQAARYCRAGVQRLLRKPPPALRGLDGLLRWVVARMSDKAVAERELLSPGAAAAAAAQRKGTSVILDVSVPRGRRRLLPPSLPARILHRLGSGVSPRGRRPPAGRARGCSPGAVPPWPGSRAARDGRYFPGAASPGPAGQEAAPRLLYPLARLPQPQAARHGSAPRFPHPPCRILHTPSALAAAAGSPLGSCIPGRLGMGGGAARVPQLPDWLGERDNPFPDAVPPGWVGMGLQPGSCTHSSGPCTS